MSRYIHTERRAIKARKIHKCCECGRTIEVGEIYNRIVDYSKQTPMEYPTCELCLDKVTDRLGLDREGAK